MAQLGLFLSCFKEQPITTRPLLIYQTYNTISLGSHQYEYSAGVQYAHFKIIMIPEKKGKNVNPAGTVQQGNFC